MNILALGDFHGVVPKNLTKILNKNKIDLVISIGDYSPFSARKLFFKYCFAMEVNHGLWEYIGKKKYKKFILNDLKKMENIMKKLNSLSVPVLTVVGNVDMDNKCDVFDIDSGKYKIKDDWDWAEQDFFSPLVKRFPNIRRIDYHPFTFKEVQFIGMNGHSNPGYPKSKSFRKSKKKLDKIFKRFDKKLPVVFVSHNIIYNTKLDKINSKGDKIVRNKHYGSKLARKIVEKYHPLVHIGGHIHEGRGVQKVRKTICINTGSIHEGEYSIININNKKVKVKLKKLG